jgi:hypothetical protein
MKRFALSHMVVQEQAAKVQYMSALVYHLWA